MIFGWFGLVVGVVVFFWFWCGVRVGEWGGLVVWIFCWWGGLGDCCWWRFVIFWCGWVIIIEWGGFGCFVVVWGLVCSVGFYFYWEWWRVRVGLGRVWVVGGKGECLMVWFIFVFWKNFCYDWIFCWWYCYVVFYVCCCKFYFCCC